MSDQPDPVLPPPDPNDVELQSLSVTQRDDGWWRVTMPPHACDDRQACETRAASSYSWHDALDELAVAAQHLWAYAQPSVVLLAGPRTVQRHRVVVTAALDLPGADADSAIDSAVRWLSDSGWVPFEAEAQVVDDALLHELRCRRCGGSGTVRADDDARASQLVPCHACGGSGVQS